MRTGVSPDFVQQERPGACAVRTAATSSDSTRRRADLDRQSLRPPETVMRLSRLGAFHQTRISFARSLIRRMARERWRITRERFEVAPDNVGDALYRIDTPHGSYSFIAFCHDIPPDLRTDRAIAQVWDYTFALCEGAIDSQTEHRLRINVPKQDAGRYSSRDLLISRANKSGRLFDEVVDSLCRGRQPDPASIVDIGYLIRTTAVFANGKFGLADYGRLRRMGAFPQPFSAQMLAVYLARQFSLDLVDHLALRRNPRGAARLSDGIRRYLGVGNATGLGLAPFIIDHPKLFNQWIWAREQAIARVKSQITAPDSRVSRFRVLLERAIRHVEEWKTQDQRQSRRLDTMLAELRVLRSLCAPRDGLCGLSGDHPWRAVAEHALAHYSAETQELVNSLILEPNADIVDDLEERMAVDETEHIIPQMTLLELKSSLEQVYPWALVINFDDPRASHYFWYKSEVKGEPRLGVRGLDGGDDREMIIGVGREVARLHRALAALEPVTLQDSTARFLLRNPTHRATVKRIHALLDCPYGEIRDNLLGADCLPIDLLRCKLAFFGAVKFDPKSDRWVRINLFQGAPLVQDLLRDSADPDDWFCPTFQAVSA